MSSPKVVENCENAEVEIQQTNIEVNKTEATTEQHSAPASEEKAAFNPSLSDDDEFSDDQLERMRGDAIGDTLYSERFVLSTLLKLTKVEKNLSDDEDFEKDLCALWDMTIEEAVVLLLLQHNVLELFTQCIASTEDNRLIEILVGMTANMCCVEEARRQLCIHSDMASTLLALTGSTDSLTLVQLMRLWTVALTYADTAATAEQWFAHFCSASPDFVQNLCFIMDSSTECTLLRQALEALNAILAKFAVIEPTEESERSQESKKEVETKPQLHFSDVFVKAALVKSTTEAFTTLASTWNTATKLLESGDEVVLPSQSAHKIMETFLNIHSILTQYGENITPNYRPHLQDVIDCLNIILETLAEPNNLLPLNNYKQNMLESVGDVFMALGDPFDGKCFRKLVTIWQLVEKEFRETEVKPSTKNANDFENDELAENKVDCESLLHLLLDFISRMLLQASEETAIMCLNQHDPKLVFRLLNALHTSNGKECRDDHRKCLASIRQHYKEKREKTNSVIATK